MMTDIHTMRTQSLDLALKYYQVRDLECVLALAGVFYEFIARGQKEINQDLLYCPPDCDDPDQTPPILARLKKAIDRNE